MKWPGTELEIGCEVPFWPEAVESNLGREPPERKDGQRERSSGREVPDADDGDRCERIAAAWGEGRCSIGSVRKLLRKTYSQKLHLLVLTEHKLGSFAPVGCMFPAVLDKARRMAVNL